MSFMATVPMYLPDVNYFIHFLKSNYLLFVDHIQYTKRSSITRSTNLANKVKLTVPVIHNGYQKSISEKQIAYKENWSNKHLKTIYHLYHKNTFFEEYFTEFEMLYADQSGRLNIFLLSSMQFFLDKLQIKSRLMPTSKIGFDTDFESNIIDFAMSLNLKNYYYKTLENTLISEKTLLRANIRPIMLIQNQNKNLLGMNILEFLFSFGPEAAFLIRE